MQFIQVSIHVCSNKNTHEPNPNTSIEVSVTEILNSDVALATLRSISTILAMVAGDSVTSMVKLTVTLLSSSKNAGSELLFKFC